MSIDIQQYPDQRRITTGPGPVTATMTTGWVNPIAPPRAVIVDVDGTLVDVNPARHHIVDRPDPDWEAFHTYGTTDAALIENTAVLVAAYRAAGVRIIVMTGRDGKWLKATERHLAGHGVQYDSIYCRWPGDRRPDVVVKRELYEQHVAGKYTPILAIDDNPSIIPLWRELGIPVHVVPGWNSDVVETYAYRLPPPPPGMQRMGDGVQTPGMGTATEAWARRRAAETEETGRGPCTIVKRTVTTGPWEDVDQPAAPSGEGAG